MDGRLYNSKIVNDFANSLAVLGASPLTIKNYVADIRQFLRWRDRSSHYFESDSQLVEMFTNEHSTKFSPSSLKRKSSAIKKYLSLEQSHLACQRQSIFKFGIYPLAGLFALAALAVPLLSYDRLELNTSGEAIVPSNYAVKNQVSDLKQWDAINFKNSRGVVVSLSSSMPEGKLAPDQMVFETAMIKEGASSDKGEGKIAKNNKEVLILNEFIYKDSFIYLTPTSPSGGQQLFVKSQGAGYMIVALQEAAAEDVTFRWKIDNTERYHNI